jgi:hypothetical protein
MGVPVAGGFEEDAAVDGGVAGEDGVEVLVSEAVGDDLSEDIAVVDGDGEVTAFEEVLGREAGPVADDTAAVHGVAEDQHAVAVAVVSS